MIPESLTMTFPVLEENVLSLQNWGMLPSRQGPPPPMPLSVIKRVRFPGGGEVSGSEGDSSFLPSALTGVLSMPDFGFPERTLGGSLQLGRLKRAVALTEEVLCGVRLVVCVLWKVVDLLAQTFEVPCKVMQKE